MAVINPEEVLNVANEMMQNIEQIDGLAGSMPGKISRMEGAAQGLASLPEITDHLNEAMRLLKGLSSNLDNEKGFLQSLAQQMTDIINRR